MNDGQDRVERLIQLRKRAETIMSSNETSLLEMTFPKARQMLHDLNTYQIELELQNKELRRAQQELEKSRQRYSALYDFAPVGYLTISSKGLVLEANITAAEMLGVQRINLIKQPLTSLISPNDQDILYRSRKKLLESKKEQTCELHFKRADGSLFSALLKNIITQEMDGSGGQFRIIIADISKQKTAEYEIQSLAKFPDENTNPVLRVSKDGSIIYGNRACLPLFSSWNCEVGSIVPDNILMHVRKSFLTKTVQKLEITHNDRIFVFSITPIIDYEYINLYGYDITEMRQIEKALFESEEKFRSLYSSMSEGVSLHEMVYDNMGKASNYRILDVNPAFEKIIGYKKENVVDRTVTEILNQEDPPYLEIYAEVADTGKAISFETYFPPLDKHFHISAFSPGRGKFATVFSDITERIQMEEELKSSAEAIKLFAYSIIHDLKNPAIATHLMTKSLCLKHIENLDDEGRLFCEQILKSSEELITLIDMINTYTETRENPLVLEEVSLNEIIMIVRKDFATRFKMGEITFVEPKNKPETITADRIALLRVLRNLVDNSLKYGGDNFSEIELTYKKSEEFHILCITDDGKGIEDDISKEMFGLFKRNRGTHAISGTGLGLAIVKEIAEKHGGRAWAEPPSGKGMTFCISIPVM